MTRERKILKCHCPEVIWMGKTLDKMTDEDCKDCLSFVQRYTGRYYVEPFGYWDD